MSNKNKVDESELGVLYSIRKDVASELITLTGLSIEQLLCVLEIPSKIDNGDYTLPIPKLNMFRKQNYKMPSGKPEDIAAEWASSITYDCSKISTSIIESANSTGSYVNIYVKHSYLIQKVVSCVLTQRDKYGTFTFGNGKKIFIEYSSPNIAKPFHAGHLRSTIIGSFLYKLHLALGYEVISENYLGDWGKQYGLLALAFERYGDPQKLMDEPIKHLFELYVKINQIAETDSSVHDDARAYFKRMEDGDEQALNIWRKMRDMSIHEYKKIYNRLGVTFDNYGGESMHGEGMDVALEILKDKQLLTCPENGGGAHCIEFPKESGLGKVVVMKKDGATLYITRDIAAAAQRWNDHKFDKMFYVVAVQQDLHFQQLFKILDMMGYEWASKCVHINFGMVQGMSTRKGEVIFLTDILDEAKQKMLEQMKASQQSKFDEIDDPEYTADMIGLSAVYAQDMSAKRGKGYSFDWDRVTSFEGDTGPYLQYNHARLCSIERKVAAKSGYILNEDEPINFNWELLREEQARVLAYQISRYPQSVSFAFQSLEACSIVNYLYDLCHAISSANSVLNILRSFVENPEEGKVRLALFKAARITLGSGLKLLGLVPLEKM